MFETPLTKCVTKGVVNKFHISLNHRYPGCSQGLTVKMLIVDLEARIPREKFLGYGNTERFARYCVFRTRCVGAVTLRFWPRTRNSSSPGHLRRSNRFHYRTRRLLVPFWARNYRKLKLIRRAVTNWTRRRLISVDDRARFPIFSTFSCNAYAGSLFVVFSRPSKYFSRHPKTRAHNNVQFTFCHTRV